MNRAWNRLALAAFVAIPLCMYNIILADDALTPTTERLLAVGEVVYCDCHTGAEIVITIKNTGAKNSMVIIADKDAMDDALSRGTKDENGIPVVIVGMSPVEHAEEVFIHGENAEQVRKLICPRRGVSVICGKGSVFVTIKGT